MKNVVTTGLVISVLFLTTSAFGQNQTKELKKTLPGKTAKTYLDLMVNVVGTNLNYGEANASLADYKRSNHGIQAGVSFQAGVTSRFSLVSELYYIRKGGNLKANNPLTTDKSSLRLNTLELPVLARLHLGKFYLNAGPSIAYNVSGKNTIGDMSTKLSFDNSDMGFKRFDAGVQIGGGFEFPCKQRRVGLDIRYNYGLTNISYDDEIYNRALMVSLRLSEPWNRNPLAKNKHL